MLNQVVQPTQGSQRITSLDLLRGFAILGILVLNIQSFAMPGAAYLNPMAYGDMNGINKWVWMLSHIFGDQKFMTIFSILFGAGIVLITQKAEAKTGRSMALHFRRTFWLLIIGLIHAHLIWSGDILVPYALCALIVYFFRNLAPRTLIVIGILIISIHTFIYVGIGSSIPQWTPENKLEVLATWQPLAADIQEEIEAYTGSIGQQFEKRSESALMMETSIFMMIFLWRAGGLMLVGMGLFKLGILSAHKSNSYYRRSWLISWSLGLPLVIWGVYKNFEAEWLFEYSMFLGSQWNYWGSLLVSYGFISLIMLWAKSSRFQTLKERLSAVGQMALTNYLLQSIICTFLFYGFGLGLFGTVDRWGQILIVFGVWIVQILWSKPWLNTFFFGPFEWIWRSLSYRKLQPFRR